MKKIIVGSFILLLFSFSLVTFQLSCSKNAIAGTENAVQQGKFIFYKTLSAGNGYGEIWVANYDGSNAKKIDLSIPVGLTLSTDGGPRLSPDCKTVFLILRETITPSDIRFHIYRCNIDGTNLQRVVEGPNVFTGENYALGVAF